MPEQKRRREDKKEKALQDLARKSHSCFSALFAAAKGRRQQGKEKRNCKMSNCISRERKDFPPSFTRPSCNFIRSTFFSSSLLSNSVLARACTFARPLSLAVVVCARTYTPRTRRRPKKTPKLRERAQMHSPTSPTFNLPTFRRKVSQGEEISLCANVRALHHQGLL